MACRLARAPITSLTPFTRSGWQAPGASIACVSLAGRPPLTVEAVRAQPRRVQDLRPVGRCQDHDAFLGIEAVHLGQQLLARLFPLTIAAHQRADAALLSQGI